MRSAPDTCPDPPELSRYRRSSSYRLRVLKTARAVTGSSGAERPNGIILDAQVANLWPISSRLRRQESCYRTPGAIEPSVRCRPLNNWVAPSHSARGRGCLRAAIASLTDNPPAEMGRWPVRMSSARGQGHRLAAAFLDLMERKSAAAPLGALCSMPGASRLEPPMRHRRDSHVTACGLPDYRAVAWPRQPVPAPPHFARSQTVAPWQSRCSAAST